MSWVAAVQFLTSVRRSEKGAVTHSTHGSMRFVGPETFSVRREYFALLLNPLAVFGN